MTGEKPDNMITSTIEYYNKNADHFMKETATVDFTSIQEMFLSLLPPGGRILDFGCGSGRDTLAFLKRGYQVDAMDGSTEMCKLAAEYTGIPVRQMQFQELSVREHYDGIWACSSICYKFYWLEAIVKLIARDVIACQSGIHFSDYLQENMKPVYDSARRQGYEVWER